MKLNEARELAAEIDQWWYFEGAHWDVTIALVSLDNIWTDDLWDGWQVYMNADDREFWVTTFEGAKNSLALLTT